MATRLAEEIRRRMKALKLNPRSLSLRAGLHEDAVRNILRGRSLNPRHDTLQKISGVLGCTVDDLLGRPATASSGRRSTAKPEQPPGYVPIAPLRVVPNARNKKRAATREKGRPPVFFPESLIRHDLKARPSDLRVMTVEGAAMEPVLFAGDTVLVDLSKTNPSQPGIFVLWDGFGLAPKWIERVPRSDPPRLRVMTENKRFADYEVAADEAQIIGRVVWFSRQLR